MQLIEQRIISIVVLYMIVDNKDLFDLICFDKTFSIFTSKLA